MADVSFRPISRLLIANRGEIARRVIRSAQDMGISTVAVYADSDATAPFVSDADTAIALNGQSPADTYLRIDKILDACQRTGADAVHPGYGFLSENAEFAQAVIDAGIAWVGPSPEAIAAMGDKLSAKALMQQADAKKMRFTWMMERQGRYVKTAITTVMSTNCSIHNNNSENRSWANE